MVVDGLIEPLLSRLNCPGIYSSLFFGPQVAVFIIEK